MFTLNGVTYLPSDVTSPVLLRRFSLGMRVFRNVANPLSSPLRPALGPISPTITPGSNKSVLGSLYIIKK